MFDSYVKCLKEKKKAIIEALKRRLFVFLEQYGALTKDECDRIDKRTSSIEERAAEIFKSVENKNQLPAYIGLSRTISFGYSEEKAMELFPFITDKWWLQILHYPTKKKDSVLPEPEEGSLSILWLSTGKGEDGIVTKVLKTACQKSAGQMQLQMEHCKCVTYEISKFQGYMLPWEKTRLTAAFIEDKLSFFKNDALHMLVANVKPSIVVLTGTCTAGNTASVKDGDIVVMKNDSTPWLGELEHMSEIWRLLDTEQKNITFQTVHYYSAKGSIASPEAMWFYTKMKNCKANGIVHFAAMGFTEQEHPEKPKNIEEVLKTNATYVVKALGHLGCHYEVSKYRL